MKKLILYSDTSLLSMPCEGIDCINVLIWGGVKLTKFLKYTYKAIAAVIVSAAAVVYSHFQSRRATFWKNLMSGGVALLAMRNLRQSALSIRQDALSIWGNALSERGNALSEWGNALSEWGNALSERGDALFSWVNDSS
jgi:hypothetical protein